MSDIDITLYLNADRVRALADALGSQTAETVEDKMTEMFDTLYQEYVPDEQRASIEARIEREDAAEQARLEAARRFAVYHIRENGDDCHFTSDYFHTPMQAAYRYRLYERGELSSAPKTFADAFIETNPVSLEYFGKVCADMKERILYHACAASISYGFPYITYRDSDISLEIAAFYDIIRREEWVLCPKTNCLTYLLNLQLQLLISLIV